MCGVTGDMVTAFCRPPRQLSKRLCLPETNTLKRCVFPPGYMMEEPKLAEASDFRCLRSEVVNGTSVVAASCMELLQSRLFKNTQKTNWQVMAMYLVYLWFRKTRISNRGQTIPRIQIAVGILHDFSSFC